MPISRPRLALPLALFAALALMLTAIAPVLAAPGGAAGSRVALTDHIEPALCAEITISGEGVISIDGVALTEAQLLLLDAEALAALRLAAETTASGAGEACVEVALGEDLIAVNADISLCPVTVEVDGEGTITLDGVVLDDALLDAELANLLEAAAAAGVEACVSVTVEDNDVFVDVVVDACVTATLNEDGSVSVDLGGVPVELPVDAIVNLDGELEVGVEAEIGLSIFAQLDITGETVLLGAEIIEIDGCGEAEPTDAPSTAPTEAPTLAPTDGAGPTDNVNPTLTITQPPTDGTTVSGESSAQVILPVMLLIVAAGGLLLLQARARRTI